MLQFVAPNEDINNYPTTPEEFFEAVGALALVKQAGWNRFLKASGLSESTGVSTKLKAEQIFKHAMSDK